MLLNKFLSWVLHPLLMPLFGMMMLLNLDTYLSFTISQEAKNYLYAIVLVNTAVFPALILLFLKARGAVSSIHLKDKSERTRIFGVSLIFYFATLNLMSKMGVPPILLSIFMGVCLALTISFTVNFITKLSIHMVGISGVLASLIVFYLKFSANFRIEIVMLVALWAMLARARMDENAHTPGQVYLGSIVGFGSVFLTGMLGITI